MLIAIDHGNYNIKTAHSSFMAGLAEHSVRPPMADEVLDKFINRFGTDNINGKIVVEADVVYETYSSTGDPYYDDSELEDSYKVINII